MNNSDMERMQEKFYLYLRIFICVFNFLFWGFIFWFSGDWPHRFQNQNPIAVAHAEEMQALYASPQKEIQPKPAPDEIRAIYLGSDNIFNEKKIAALEKILETTNANGIVVDFKDSNSPSQEYMSNLVKRFKKHNTYTIARIVAFQDSSFARKHPEVAIKTSSGEFWWSGRKAWKRYWLDPASESGTRL